MKKEKGAILIEAIIGLTIAIMIITGLVTAMVSSLSNSTFSRNQTIATGYSQEAMELIRSMKDDDFEALYTRASQNATDWCLDASGTSISRGTCAVLRDNDAEFTRSITLRINNTSECYEDGSIFVETNVSWEDSKCTDNTNCHKVSLRSCLSNLNYVPLD